MEPFVDGSDVEEDGAEEEFYPLLEPNPELGVRTSVSVFLFFRVLLLFFLENIATKVLSPLTNEI